MLYTLVMKNNAHESESKEHRLKRLQDGHPIEAIETLLNSIDNYFNNEIRLTVGQAQTTLLFLGVHAVALTIAEVFFGQGGPEGYKWFLEKYVDGDTNDTKFSQVAEVLHDWRNILAHQWIGSLGHDIIYDYQTELGWERRDRSLAINPRIYYEQYIAAFSAGGKLWRYDKMFTEQELEEIKDRIVEKYKRR